MRRKQDEGERFWMNEKPFESGAFPGAVSVVDDNLDDGTPIAFFTEKIDAEIFLLAKRMAVSGEESR